MRHRFSRGLHLLLVGKGEYTIERRLPDGEFQLKAAATDELTTIREECLINSLFEGGLEILGDERTRRHVTGHAAERYFNDLSLLDEKVRLEVKRRWTYVSEAVRQRPQTLTKATLTPIIEQVTREIGDENPPSWNTLYRWFRNYEASGRSVHALVPATDRRVSGKPRFSPNPDISNAVVNIINAVIEEKFLSRHRPTIASVWETVVARIASENEFRNAAEQLPIPHRTSIYRRVKKLDPYDVMRARFGPRIADQRFDAVGQGPRPSRPLERVEIDHTKLDLLVVDPMLRLPVGRPWLTLAVDKFSRMIIGFYMSFHPPGYLSVAQCLLHAIRPKNYVRERFPQIVNTWDAYGLPETIVTDNALEFHSKNFEDACLQIGVIIQYAKIRRGQDKGTVERALRTHNQQLLHGQPGTTFSNVLDCGDYDPASNAVISVEALDEMIHTYVIDVHNQREHRGLRDIPARVWRAATAEWPPALPPRHTDLSVLLGSVVRRTVSASGIELHTLFYNSDELALIRRRLKRGERVTVKIDPTDLSLIWVADRERRTYVPVPAVNQEYTRNLSLWQHNVIRSYARRVLKIHTDIIGLCRAKARIQEIVEREWRASKRASSRQRIARYRGYGASSHAEHQSRSALPPAEEQPGMLVGETVGDAPRLIPAATLGGVSDIGIAVGLAASPETTADGTSDAAGSTLRAAEPPRRPNKRSAKAAARGGTVAKRPAGRAAAAPSVQDRDEAGDETGWGGDFNLPR
ncbi:MAG: transposase [Acidobacteria bacterium]|nr:transposase [Acidobacteriota bacterium]